jgi:flagellar basal-body rod protein FlgG
MSSSLFHTLNISRQDMLTRLQDLDVVSNNLSNMNTAGFKSSRSNFQELLANTNQRDGIRIPSTQALTGEGALKTTTNQLDWAIQGEGYFAVRLPDNTIGYTRDGQLHMDANRNLVTASGYKLIWSGTQVPPEATGITLRQDGTVQYALPDGTAVAAGTVQLAKFINPSGLTTHGNNVWLPSAASGAATMGVPGTGNLGTVANNQVEQSNVNIAREMTNLMTDQRTFQMSVKAFQQTDQMINQAINLRKG